MTEHMESPDLQVKVVMMGPSRVGKTTLLTAVLSETRERLAGTPVTLDPADEPTRILVKQNAAELQGELHAGEFTGGGLQSTQEVTEYAFRLAAGVGDEAIAVNFMDFPGSLLSTTQTVRQSDWERVRAFAAEAIAMLVPIDATVIMEAVQPRHRAQWTHLLDLQSVEDGVRDWARARAEKDEPAVLVLSPVKCESYFTDNGGRVERASELRERVLDEVYADIIRAAVLHCPEVLVYYCPVDSIGCVEVERVDWVTESVAGPVEATPRLSPEVTFLVRRPARRRTLGAEGVVVLLVREIVRAANDEAKRREVDALRKHQDAASERDQARGFFTQVSEFFGGQQRQRVRDASHAGEGADLAAARWAEYQAVLKSLSEVALSPRSSRVDVEVHAL